MKIHNRILSTLLAVILFLGTFVAFPAVNVSAAAGDADEIIESTYVTTVYNKPEEKLATMKKMYARGNYELYVDSVSGEVATRDIRTGDILFTNPYDVASSKGSESTKKQILSQISVQYIDNGATKYLYSFEEAAMREQIKVLNIKNGVRVEYSIGREESRKLVPRWIEQSSFDRYIKAPLEAAVANGDFDVFYFDKFMANYKPEALSNKPSKKQKEKLIKDYPCCEFMDIYVFDATASSIQLNYCESYIKNFCDNYTFEQMDADHAKTGYKEKDEKFPLFKMALEYSLDDNGVNVTLPCNGVRYDMSTYTMENFSVLPYMGAGSSKNTGYNFYPDGAGALFDFEKLDLKTETSVRGKLYGTDYAYHQISGTYQKVIRYPVYGTVAEEVFNTFTYSAPIYQKDEKGNIVKKNGKPVILGTETITETISNTVVSKDEIADYVASKDGTLLSEEITVDSYKRGYVAIIESGESLAELSTYHAGSMSDYNTMINYFNPKPKDSYDIADSISVSSSSSWTVVSDRKFTGNIKISYQMLTDKKQADKATGEGNIFYAPTWFGMAEAYRDHLVANGTLKPLTNTEANIPLYMEVFGTVETQEQIATIPVDVMTPLTTFDNILTMYNELSGEGVKNINFKLTGFANGGLGMETVPASLKWEKAVGGAKGFRELIAKATEINAKDGEHIGLYPDFDFAYISRNTMFDSTNLKKDAIKTIDNRYSSRRQYSATQQAYVSFYQLAVSPSRYSKFYTKLLANYEEYALKSLSIGSLGHALNSDFDEDEPYNREDNKFYTAEAFEDMQKAGYSLMTESANAYTWGYVDHILNLDLDSSRYIKASASVPFIGVVLHGYVQFAGTPLNEEGDTDYAILRALENGAGLYFILSYQNTSKLKEFEDLSQYYSVRYDIWKEDVVSYYNELNELLKDVQTKVIIDHQFLTGKRVLDVDELEAELEEMLKDAAEKEKEEQQAIITENVLKIANAWKLAENAVDTVEDLLAEMKQLNADMELDAKSLASMTSEETFKGFVESALELMRVRYDGDGNPIDPLPAEQAASSLIAQLNAVRNLAADILRQHETIKKLKADGDQLLLDVAEAKTVISESDLDATVKQNMMNSIDEYLADATDLFNNGNLTYKKAEDYVTQNVAMVTSGDDKYIVPVALACLDLITSENAEEEIDLRAACAPYFFDEAALLEQGKLVEDDTNAGGGNTGNTEQETENKKADNNQIVIVTYGDRDATTHAKTAYKSFILNYNNYSVIVEYNGVVYTIPSGGYVVLYHN